MVSQTAPPQPPPTGNRPDRRPENPEAQLERYRRVRTPLLWLIGTLLLSYLASGLVLPWKLATLGFSLGGLVLGVIVLARSGGIVSKWAVRLSAIFGMIGCAFFGLFAVSQIAFWNATTDYESCMAGAITDTARVNCETTYFSELGISSPEESSEADPSDAPTTSVSSEPSASSVS